MDLEKEVQFIKGVGPNRVKLLNRIGIYTLNDLITYFPREYEDRSKTKNIAELIDGEEVLISAFPVGRMIELKIRRNLTLCKLYVRDETGGCELIWYNQGYLKNVFKQNVRYNFYGKIKKKNGKYEIQSPVYEENGADKSTGKIVPIYPLTYSLTQRVLSSIIEAGNIK